VGINVFKEYIASIYRVKVSKVRIVAGYIEAVPLEKMSQSPGWGTKDGAQVA
jgi:hypothetical protein